MADIFSEVKEDLRSDNYIKIAKKYGKYFIGAIFVTLLAVAVYTAQKNISIRKKEAAGSKYFSALNLIGGQDSARGNAVLNEIALSNTYGFKEVSALMLARSHLENNQPDKAIAAYETIANDRKAERSLRDLALLNATFLQIKTGKDTVKIDDNLDQLSKSGRPWRPFALELKAYRNIEAGNPEEARKIFNTLKSDLSTPENIRQRAEQLSNIQNYEK